jgi:two-component system, OmpR family, alkaline phosphatase synthesis response regulator PhoP
MKILIVDDSRFLRTANERALVRAGHNVMSASDGQEGLRLAIEHTPDFIVLDMMLPKMSGPDVLQALRKHSATARIPVMVLTSLSQANEERLISEGATAYFEKSLLTLDKGTGRFVEAVEKMLSKLSQAKAAAASAL